MVVVVELLEVGQQKARGLEGQGVVLEREVDAVKVIEREASMDSRSRHPGAKHTQGASEDHSVDSFLVVTRIGTQRS